MAVDQDAIDLFQPQIDEIKQQVAGTKGLAFDNALLRYHQRFAAKLLTFQTEAERIAWLDGQAT